MSLHILFCNSSVKRFQPSKRKSAANSFQVSDFNRGNNTITVYKNGVYFKKGGEAGLIDVVSTAKNNGLSLSDFNVGLDAEYTAWHEIPEEDIVNKLEERGLAKSALIDEKIMKGDLPFFADFLKKDEYENVGKPVEALLNWMDKSQGPYQFIRDNYSKYESNWRRENKQYNKVKQQVLKNSNKELNKVSEIVKKLEEGLMYENNRSMEQVDQAKGLREEWVAAETRLQEVAAVLFDP